jgi:hypothetical protein
MPDANGIYTYAEITEALSTLAAEIQRVGFMRATRGPRADHGDPCGDGPMQQNVIINPGKTETTSGNGNSK